jgi:hypothetical protein
MPDVCKIINYGCFTDAFARFYGGKEEEEIRYIWDGKRRTSIL